jgi:hypothetical protein
MNGKTKSTIPPLFVTDAAAASATLPPLFI